MKTKQSRSNQVRTEQDELEITEPNTAQLASAAPDDTTQESLIDTSRPSAGRIYDYWLGGNHNFDIDRQVADQVANLLPFVSKMVRLQRWCLRNLAIDLTYQRGFDVIVDFASGLPTQDHIHHKAKPGTTIIYSDLDEITVDCGCGILGDTPDVYYFHADARRPENLLNDLRVKRILGERQNVALIYWGIGAGLTDEELAHAAGPQSCLAFNAQAADLNPDHPATKRAIEIYKQMGMPANIRSLEKYEQLLQPWCTGDKGFVPLLEWHDLDRSLMTEDDVKAWGESGGGYGAYLTK
jgi:hypothetical protein